MSSRRLIFCAAALALFACDRVARAAEFHFTVTADPRGQHAAFADTLQAINNLVGGPGAFHVSPGDIDETIPENRAVIDAYFGPGALWYPGAGNHETETPADMVWLRNEYHNGNGLRPPLKDFTNQDGPAGSKETTYTWDYGNAHFIQLNQYWDGLSDTGTNGDIVPALYDWLAADLAANTQPAVFVFGHEPAFPYNRHVGDSLDAHPARRDAFWQLLEDYDVTAFFCGHTHYYSTHLGDRNHIGDVWQVDAGNAGNGWPQTFINVAVGETDVRFEAYTNAGGWHRSDSWTVPIFKGPPTLRWDGKGPGYWHESRWVGNTLFESPDETTHAVVKTDVVTVAARESALALTVESGQLVIDSGAVLTVSEGVDVLAGATLKIAGTLDAQSLTTAGTHVIAGGATLSVDTALTLDSSLNLTGATLNTIPQVTTIHVNRRGALTLDQQLVAGELTVAGSVQAAGVDVAALNLRDGGLLSSSADVTARNAEVTGGTIRLTEGARLHVTAMQVTGGMVDTGTGDVVVGRSLKIGAAATFGITDGTFRIDGPNLADPAEPSDLTLSGGRLSIAGGTGAPFGAIAIWRFNEFHEGEKITTLDSSYAGNDHLATLERATPVSDGSDHRTALSFEGSALVEAANTGDIEFGAPFTIGMWIKTLQRGGELIGKGNGDGTWGYFDKALYLDAEGGQVTFGCAWLGSLDGKTDVADGEWHHLAVTYNGSTAPGHQEIYVDGVNDTHPTGRRYIVGTDPGHVFRLGSAETTELKGCQQYIGLMDDVYLYDRSLSPAEVADLYQAIGSVLDPMPNTNLRVTAHSTLHLETAAEEAILGDLALDAGKGLEVTGAAVQFDDVTAGDGSSIEGDLRVGGILSPGDSLGTLGIVGNLTIQAGSTYRWDLGASGNDVVNVGGGRLLLETGWRLQLHALGGRAVGPDEHLYLFTFGEHGHLDGSSDLAMNWDGALELLGDDWDIGNENWNPTLQSDTTGVYVTGVVAVPEPSALLLLGSAVLVLLLSRARQRHSR